jgi:hypothetical protein
MSSKSDQPDSDQLQTIEAKVLAGERISFDEGLYLENEVDVLTLGRLANIVRERKNGNLAYYNTNIHLNPTNVCVYRCVFCAFRSDLKAEKAYTFDDDMIRERVLEAKSQGATEIHVVGGLHHQKPFQWYVDVVRVIHETWPEIHIKAWTGVEMLDSAVCPAVERRFSTPTSEPRSANTKPTHNRGSISTAMHTNWAYERTRRCCTAILRKLGIALITCANCENCKTKREGSKPSFR